MRSLPGLVAEAFPAVRGVRLEQLGLAHILLAFVAFVDDRLNDAQTAFTREAYLVRRSMEAEAEAQLTAAVGARAEFWCIAQQMFERYTAAHAREARRWSGAPCRDNHIRCADEAAGKIAIAQLPAVAAALIGGASRVEIARLTAAFDHCFVALQYTDDVADWEDDFSGNRWTYFVRRHLRPSEARGRRAATVTQLKRRIASGSAPEEFLARAVRHYDAALEATRGLALPTLRAWIEACRDAAQADAAARRQPLVEALRQVWRS